jgi:hypothetical protein
VTATAVATASEHRARIPAVALALLGVVTATAVGWWWLTHPSTITPYGSSIGARVAAGQVIHLDSGITTFQGSELHRSSARIGLQSVTPRVTENTAYAEITIQLCRRNIQSVGVGAVTGPLVEFCASLVPVASASAVLSPDAGGDQIVVSVRPTRDGQVVIEGFDVRYTDGVRRGSSHAGLELRITTP